MPRRPRKQIENGIYHCILRGINKQDIFFDNQDYFKFLKILKKSKQLFQFKLYSYILMPNHIHLEFKDEKNLLSETMHNIAISYAKYFNLKYKRIGHVFENRYKSKIVGSDDYILNLLRYIHQNPQKALICATEEYKWSSYKEYIHIANIVDTEEILNMFDEDKYQSIQKFIEFNKKEYKMNTSSELLEYEMKTSLTDNELIEFIKKELNIENIQDIQKYSKLNRDKLLNEIKSIEGWTHKQLSRVLGINIRILQRAIKK